MKRLAWFVGLGIAALTISGESQSSVVYRPLTVEGTPSPIGRADPSHLDGWLVSSIPTRTDLPVTSLVDSIELAQRVGDEWRSTQIVFQGRDEGGLTWKYEVPSLARFQDGWMVFAHKMAWREKGGPKIRASGQVYAPKGNDPRHGGIAFRTAASPDGSWSTERVITAADWNSFAKGRLPRQVAYTEPGALWHDGWLYLALKAHPSLDSVLFRTQDLAAWEYVGPLFSKADAEAMGHVLLDAVDLFEVDGTVYAIAAPRGVRKWFRSFLFEVTDLARAELRRENGVPQIIQTIDLPPEVGRGTATYSEELGYIMHGITVRSNPKLSIWSNGVFVP